MTTTTKQYLDALPGRIAAIRARCAEGASWPQIAVEFEFSSIDTAKKFGNRHRIRSGARRGGQLVWTPEEDALLLDLRAQGLSYAKIARALGKSENAILGRAGRLRGPLPAAVVEPVAVEPPPPVVERFERAHGEYVLPAGHRDTWALINAGLVNLQGVEFRR